MDSAVTTKKMGGTFRSNTFMQLNKSSRLLSSLGLRLTDGTQPAAGMVEYTLDYTALILRAKLAPDVEKLPANKFITIETPYAINPRGFHAIISVSPELLEIADVQAPTVILPGMEYAVKFRVKFKQDIKVEDLPVLGYVMLVG